VLTQLRFRQDLLFFGVLIFETPDPQLCINVFLWTKLVIIIPFTIYLNYFDRSCWESCQPFLPAMSCRPVVASRFGYLSHLRFSQLLKRAKIMLCSKYPLSSFFPLRMPIVFFISSVADPKILMLKKIRRRQRFIVDFIFGFCLSLVWDPSQTNLKPQRYPYGPVFNIKFFCSLEIRKTVSRSQRQSFGSGFI
jgi:hypothetical protein